MEICTKRQSEETPSKCSIAVCVAVCVRPNILALTLQLACELADEPEALDCPVAAINAAVGDLGLVGDAASDTHTQMQTQAHTHTSACTHAHASLHAHARACTLTSAHKGSCTRTFDHMFDGVRSQVHGGQHLWLPTIGGCHTNAGTMWQTKQCQIVARTCETTFCPSCTVRTTDGGHTREHTHTHTHSRTRTHFDMPRNMFSHAQDIACACEKECK